MTPTAGTSTCPICKKTWTVTPAEDCFMPACGHYGSDASAANLNRPCEACGYTHILSCRGMSPDTAYATRVPTDHPARTQP